MTPDLHKWINANLVPMYDRDGHHKGQCVPDYALARLVQQLEAGVTVEQIVEGGR